MNYVYDVIIIGAGISGLVAAHTILEKEPSLDIIILEAQDRIGGRTLSLPVKVTNNNTCLFDAGAHWVSSSQTHLQRYITLLNLNLVQQQRGLAIGVAQQNSFNTFNDHPAIGNILTSYEIRSFFTWLEEQSALFQFGSVHNQFTNQFYDSVTMEYYIDSRIYTTAAKNVAKHIIRTTTGVEASQISVMNYLLFCNSSLGFTNTYMQNDGGGREFWIQEGAQEICYRLENIIGKENIVLQEPVAEINNSAQDIIIIITKSGNKYCCNRLICAIPPDQILKLSFLPKLSRQKRLVLEEAQVGHLTKFIITYQTTFWRLHGYSGEIFACKDGPVSMCHDGTKNDNPALIGYIQVPNDIQPGPDGTYKKSVIEQLKKYWGEDAKEFIDYVEYCWWDEPYSGGCPTTSPGTGILKWYHIFNHLSDRIQWAGAETATEWNGYMNGAVQAGYRTAINTLYEMRPQCLTTGDLTYINTKRKYKTRLKSFTIFNKYTVLVAVVGFVIYKYYIKDMLSK